MPLELVEQEKTCGKGASFWKNVEIWASKKAFSAFWSKNESAEQNEVIIKFWLFYSVTAHEYSI